MDDTMRMRVLPDRDSLSREVAEHIVRRAKATVESKGRFTLALAGGSTPRMLYTRLATDFATAMPWDKIHLFWGDERYVPSDDPHSNFHMVHESLLEHIPLPREHIHPMPTGYAHPEEAADAHERLLRQHFDGAFPRFDLLLLGLGVDGHTASLFPGSPALAERSRWVVTSRAPVEPHTRLTLTLPVLNHAAHIFFIVAGDAKADALRCVQGASGPRPDRCPASAVRPIDGDVAWWLDAVAFNAVNTRTPAHD